MAVAAELRVCSRGAGAAATLMVALIAPATSGANVRPRGQIGGEESTRSASRGAPLPNRRDARSAAIVTAETVGNRKPAYSPLYPLKVA